MGVYVWDKDVAVLNQHIFKVELGDNFDRVFFYYLIKTKIDEIVSHVHGSTMKHITKDRFDNIKVKLPPLSIQKQIAEILEKADRAKQKRKEANKLTDEFLQSVFIEMFGDPVKNPKGWEVQELNQMAEIERDSVTSKNFLTSDLYIGLEHIEKDSGRLLGYESVDKIELKSNKFRFTSDHILYGKLRPYLNKVFLPKFNGVCSTDIIPIKPRKNISNKYFLTYLMRMDFFVKEATTKSTGANLPRISPHLLGKIKLYTPPLSLQQQFTEIVNKTESLKEKQKQSEQELENLFHSLMQKAFKGELVA
ncbi:MAG: restriction endonuclease subunit S [Ignavibacterium sp.]|nr:restriction endonuclease subunit S [Ignavibacterium sp.]